MKKNLLFVPLLAVLTLLTASVLASGELAKNVEVTFNGVELLSNGNPLVGMVGDNVPVRVTFDANDSSSDVRLKVRIEGVRDDVSASTERFDIIEGKTYTKVLTLELPNKLRDTDKEFTLIVEIVSAEDRTEKLYTIAIQRESYVAQFLAVDYNTRVSAGEVVPVVATIKNTGFNRLDDIFVVVQIPDLGIFSRGFVGDLVPTEDFDEDEEDSFSKTVYFKIPENAKVGVYEMEVIVYSDDSETSVKKLISVEGSSADVIAAVRNKDIKAGETVNYEFFVVNSADNVKVFRLNAVTGNDLDVSVPSVITVGPKTSESVSLSVTADNNAPVGTQTFTVEVDGKPITFGANIVEGNVSTSVVALTVVLVIVFIVLLAVLIILLTRKEKPMEEVETSYY